MSAMLAFMSNFPSQKHINEVRTMDFVFKIHSSSKICTDTPLSQVFPNMLSPLADPALLFLFATGTLGAIAPTHLFLSRVGSCTDARKMAVSVSELSITRSYYDFLLSGQLNITGNFSDGWDVKATMQKCPDIRNIDTCDHYRSFTVVHGGCTGESVDGFNLYSMFFHYLHPKMQCPILPGIYRIESYPFFTEDNYLAVAEAKISTSVFGYTFRLEGFSDTEQIMCVEAYLRLLYIRDHNWLDFDAGVTTEPDDNDDSDDNST